MVDSKHLQLTFQSLTSLGVWSLTTVKQQTKTKGFSQSWKPVVLKIPTCVNPAKDSYYELKDSNYQVKNS